jgi:hypothetical protein
LLGDATPTVTTPVCISDIGNYSVNKIINNIVDSTWPIFKGAAQQDRWVDEMTKTRERCGHGAID